MHSIANVVMSRGLSNLVWLFLGYQPFKGPYDDVALFHETRDYQRLGNLVIELAEKSDFRTKMAESGLELAENNYTFGEVVKQYRELYEDITDRELPSHESKSEIISAQ